MKTARNPHVKSSAKRVRRSSVLRASFVAAVVSVALLTFPKDSPASIEEQRARLPPPAECTDELEGEWLALTHSSTYDDWYQVRLTIKRTSPGAQTVEGQMRVRFWFGDDNAMNPPPCTERRAQERVVIQPSLGTYIDNEVQFHAQSWSFAPESCFKSGRYNLDNYSGRIDHKLHEFQSVNNDGGRAVNEPAVFRRVKCINGPDVLSPTMSRPVDVKAPSFTPKRKWGCGT